LIDDLLEYSHVNVHAKEMEWIDLNKKLALVLTDLELPVKESGAVITVGELPTIKGFRRQIQQLFQNLISNALKYTKPGVRPEITITSQEVSGQELPPELPLQDRSGRFHLIEITDNGIGFDPTDADRIFSMFTRLHSKEYSGTGVGLSIV